MARGRRANSPELHLKLGNPSKKSRKVLERAVALDQSQPAMIQTGSPADSDTGSLTMPPGLQPPPYLNETAREAWSAIVPLIAPAVKASDVVVLARYVDLFARWLHARASMADRRAKGGIRYTYKSRTREGGERKYLDPMYRVMTDSEREMRAIEAVLPLTPASRAGIYQRLAEIQDPTRPPLQTKPAGAVPPTAGQANGSHPPPAPNSPIGLLTCTKPH